MPGPAPEAPAPAPVGILEFLWRAWALTQVGPQRLAHGMAKEIPLTDSNVQEAHLNTSGKPMFVEVRVVVGDPAPVLFVSGQQSCDIRQSQSVNLANEVFRGITYPGDRLFIRKNVPGTMSVMVTEVTL